jgi:hypothetical protein
MHYGRFHVVFKKQGDQWKIAQDWDSYTINGHKERPKDLDKLRKDFVINKTNLKSNYLYNCSLNNKI